MDTSDRTHLKFEKKVRRAFAFLEDMGFSEIEALPTLVRYKAGRVEVDIYHGRRSYEVGIGITAFGVRCTLSELIRVSQPEVADKFRLKSTTTVQGLVTSLDELSSLIRRYGTPALQGDPGFFSTVEEQRRRWSREYALDVLAEQLKPQANEAFRRKDYSTAADLYSRIRDRLTPAELKKLTFAKSHRHQ